MDASETHNLLLRELDAVHRLAYHLTSSRQDVEDLVQETYVRALKAADRFQLTEFGPRPWLFKILHNLVASHYGSKRRETDHLDRLRRAPSKQNTEGAADFTGVADLPWETVDERLKHALEALPMPARIAFLLYAVEGLKYREIAEVTGVPVGTVMSRLSRAREELASRLGAYARERGWDPMRRAAVGKNDSAINAALSDAAVSDAALSDAALGDGDIPRGESGSEGDSGDVRRSDQKGKDF